MVDPASASSQSGNPATARATPAALAASVRSACPGMLSRRFTRPSSSWASTWAWISTPGMLAPEGERGVRCRSVPDSTVPTSTTFPASQSGGSRGTSSAGYTGKGGVPGCGPLRQSMRNGSAGTVIPSIPASRAGKLGLPSSAEAGTCQRTVPSSVSFARLA